MPTGLLRLFPGSVAVAEVRCAPGEEERLDALYPEEHAVLGEAGEKRRREFRAGRHAARAALATLGVAPAGIACDAHGVPSFPAGVRGALAHTGRGEVLAVAAATCDPLWLGIDVERLRPVSAGLAARVLAPAELEQLGAVCSPDLAPLLGFSAKEAVYKAVFPVLRRVLGFHEVVLEAEGPGALRAHVPADRIEGVEVRLTCEHGLVLAGAAFER